MPTKLKEQLEVIGILDSPASLIGKKFGFFSGRYEMVGTITGLRTGEDGLPLLEVSNRTFTGYRFIGISLMDDSAIVIRDDGIRIEGNFTIF